MSEITEKYIVNTFGVGKTFSKKAQKKLGLNLRTNLSFFKKQHFEKLDHLYKKLKTGKVLKQYIKNCVRFNNKVKKYKKLTNDSKNISKKNTKQISKKK